MNEGIRPICGGTLHEDTSRGEYGWVACDTCDYTSNIHLPETRKENNNG